MREPCSDPGQLDRYTVDNILRTGLLAVIGTDVILALGLDGEGLLHGRGDVNKLDQRYRPVIHPGLPDRVPFRLGLPEASAGRSHQRRGRSH